MGCSSCSTTSGNTPAGCKSNGSCDTGGCNKLNVYNWLADMVMPEGHKAFDIVEVRFKGSRKEYFRNTNNLELKTGEMVAVEGNPGHDIGEVSLVGELVRFQLRKRNLKEDSAEIKALYRIAKPNDLEKWTEVKTLEHKTMHRSRTIALALGLKMKLSDVEYQGDGKKATFYYTADERVDFRELIKRLADEFKVRVEMRQIGMRQEAARLGGIGSCGRELCCSTWLTDFKIVSTSAARYQNLSLNPLKLAGQCGKLKCCLNYELDTYLDAIRDIPESNIKLLTGKGTMLHRKTDIFKRIMWYALIPEVKEGEDRPFMGAENWIPMSVDRVKEIIALNKQQIRPDDTGHLDLEEEEDEHDYKDVVGQDSLTRMDRKKKKKKKKSGNNDRREARVLPMAGAEAPVEGAAPQQRNNNRKDNRNRPQQQNAPQQGNRPQGQKPQQQQGQNAKQGNNPQQGNNQQRGNRPAQGNNRNRPNNPQQQQQGNQPQQNQPRPPQSQQPAPTPQQGSAAQQGPAQPRPQQSSGNRPPRQRPGDKPADQA